jgi:lysophospholipase L1-like esterase
MPFYKLIILIFLSAFCVPEKKKIKVWLVGDSTMSVKEVKAYPETGWGMPFSHFFDSTVVVDNRAKNGRSTKSFKAEGLWQPIVESLQEGDYVFIQFGHNDEGKEKVGRYTTPEQFRANLTAYVADTRAKKAIAVLITPAARRRFDSTGNVVASHPGYSEVVRSVAEELGVALIDLDKKSQELLQKLGTENSKLLFNHLAPNEHPNYPDGKIDDTHFNELGARRMAQLVLSELKALNLELARRIVKVHVKKIG